MTADYRVTGVFKDLPKNSHFDMTAVVRVDPADYFRKTPGAVTFWTWSNGEIYVRLKPGSDAKAIEAQFPPGKSATFPTISAAIR